MNRQIMPRRRNKSRSKVEGVREEQSLPAGIKLVRTLSGHAGGIGRIAWSPDGTILASPSQDKTIRLWDAGTGACLRILEGHHEGVHVVAFAPDGRMLASGGGDFPPKDASIRLWNIDSGELLKRFPDTRNRSPVSHLARRATCSLAGALTGEEYKYGTFYVAKKFAFSIRLDRLLVRSIRRTMWRSTRRVKMWFWERGMGSFP